MKAKTWAAWFISVLIIPLAFSWAAFPLGELASLPRLGVWTVAASAFVILSWTGFSFSEHYLEGEEQRPEGITLFLARLVSLYLLTFAAMAGAFVLSESRYADPWARLSISFVAGCAGCLITYLGFFGQSDPHRRGRRMLSDAEKRKTARKVENEANRSENPPVFFAAHWLPFEVSLAHYLVMGATNTGKSKIIEMLMKSVLGTIGLGRDARAVIFDASGDIMSFLAGLKLKCDVRTLNPLDRRCYAWAMWRDLTTRTDAQTLAANLLPIDEHASQKFFDKAVRSLIQEVVWALIKRTRKTKAPWTLRDVLLAVRNRTRLETLLKTTPEGRDVLELCFADPETAANIMATVNTSTDPFLAVAACWHRAEKKGRSVSLTDWLKDEYILVLGNSHTAREAVRAINQVIFTRLTQLILSQSESLTRRNWVFLDEVRQAGRLAALTDLMVEGRKRGACVCLGFQDIEGMIHVHTHHLAKELVGQAHNVAITKLVNPETAQLVSRMFGDYEARITKVSYTRGPIGMGTRTIADQIEKREAVSIGELESMPIPNRRIGLHFYALVPALGAFRHVMSGEEVESHQVKRNSDPRRGGSVDFAPRPDHHQELRPWTRADYERIGIEPPKETEKPAEEPKVEPEPEPKQEAKPKVEPEPKQEAKPKDEASERHEPPRKPGKLPPFRRPDNGGRESMH